MTTVCRVCLTGGGGDVELSTLEDARLKDVYKKLTNTQFYSEDGRPTVVCSLCYRNLLRCWTLSEMACRSENIFSNLLYKGLKATHEFIKGLNLETKQLLSMAPMQISDLDNETPKNSSAMIIKEEPISVKEEETEQDELVDTESADTHISEECIKIELKFEEDSNYFFENSTKMDIVQPNLEEESDKLYSDQELSQNQNFEVHSDNSKTFCCDICSKMFLVRSSLVSHIQLSHTNEQQCKIFDKKVSDFHFKQPKSVDTGEKPHTCCICEKQFNKKSHLARHMRTHNGLRSYVCSICDRQYKKKYYFVKHIKIHTGAMPYACSVCDKQCEHKSTLVTHMRIHAGVKPYACSICDNKQFSKKSLLVRHMRIHTGVKPYACSICGTDKQFNEKSDLLRHMRTHDGLRSYVCNICDKQYKKKSFFVKHMKIHTGATPYACSVCDKECKHKSTLVTHMRIHSGVKPYACSICEKQFNQKSHLVRHMRIHTGVKLYACSICETDKQFNEKSDLVRHMRTHTRVKPYPCSVCGKPFNKKAYLKSHMIIHAAKKPAV